MKNIFFNKGLLVAGLALMLSATTPTALHALQYGGPPPGQGYNNGQGGWDAPPGGYSPASQHGFHDGLEGARKDYENHRPPNVNNRDEYRHPNVGGRDRHEYRQGFRAGYDAGVRHFMNGGGPR